MTEQEYIIVTNRAKITAAKNAIANCSTNADSGVSKGQQKTLLDILHTIEARLFRSTERFMEYDELQSILDDFNPYAQIKQENE